MRKSVKGVSAVRICICDDDAGIHPVVRELLQKSSVIPNKNTVTSFYTGEELVNHYASGQTFDLIFLDVEMPGLSGMDAARKIRETDESVIIVFISCYRDYVFGTFPLSAFHYIVKPICPEEFEDVYQRSVQKYQNLHATIYLKWMYDRHEIPIHKILYVEGVHRHVVFHTLDGIYEGVGKLSEYTDTLSSNGFIQVHHSYIVNLDCIKSIVKDKIILKNGENIWISARKRMETLKTFDHYIGKGKW